VRKDFWLPETREGRSLMKALEDERRATGKSFSRIIYEALSEHVDSKRVFVQAKLSDFQAEMIMTLEELHQQFVHPNPNRYPTWENCLESEGLLSDESRRYSESRGWMRPAPAATARVPRPKDISPSSPGGQSSSAATAGGS